MLSQNQVKGLTALQVKKYRQKYRKFTVEGDKMVLELLRQDKFEVESVFGLAEWEALHARDLDPFRDRFTAVTPAELDKISALTTPNRVLAVVHLPEVRPPAQDLQAGFHFYLDGLQDPGNMGTVWRVADWFGMGGVWVSPDSVDAFSPKVIQSSMGAFLRVPTAELPLADLLEQVPDLPVIGTVLEGDNLFHTAWPRSGLVVIGREGRGLSEAAERRLTHRLTIPRGAAGGAESLNAAVAAGIVAAVLHGAR